MLFQLASVVIPKVFLLQYGARKGRSTDCLAILWITRIAGTTRTSLSGF